MDARLKFLFASMTITVAILIGATAEHTMTQIVAAQVAE